MGTGRRDRRRAAIAAIAAVVCSGVLVTGCSDGDASSASPDPEPSTPSGSTASSPSTSTSPTSPTSPTTSAPSGPAPATGREMVEDRVSVRAPQGWKVRKSDINPHAISAHDPDSLSSFILSDFPAVGDRTIDGEAADALDFHGPDVKRVADFTWGGLPAYRVQGKSGVMRLIEVGALHEGGDITVQFELSPLQEPAEQRRVVESVLASVQWR